MASPQFYFDIFTEALMTGLHDFSTATLAVVVTTHGNAPDIVNDEALADLTIVDIESDLVGDMDLVISSQSQSSGTYRVFVDDKELATSGSTLGPFRHVVLYNKGSGLLICTYDLGDDISIVDGTPLTLDFSQATGAIVVRPSI